MSRHGCGTCSLTMLREGKRDRVCVLPGSLLIAAGVLISARNFQCCADMSSGELAGPEGTPYEAGCYVFDLFFPQQYPAVAPLMHFDTNGQGRARMNPNLYADGKVRRWRLLDTFSEVALTSSHVDKSAGSAAGSRVQQQPAASRMRQRLMTRQ